MRAGPCPPAAQAPTCIGHIETWAGRPATGNTSRVVFLTQVLGYPTLLPVLMEDALQANCMTIMWIQTGLSISNFQIIQFDLNPGKGKQKVLKNIAIIILNNFTRTVMIQ